MSRWVISGFVLFFVLYSSSAFCQSSPPSIIIGEEDNSVMTLPEPFNGNVVNVAIGEPWSFFGYNPYNNSASLSLVNQGKGIQSYSPYLYSVGGSAYIYSTCLPSEPSGYPPCPYFGWVPFGSLPSSSYLEGAWYKNGFYNVTLTAQYPNQSASSVSGTVNVQMPTNIGANVIIDMPQVWPVTPSSSTSTTQYLMLGNYLYNLNPGGVHGVTIDVGQTKAPFGYTGAFQFNQFIKDVTINFYLNGQIYETCTEIEPSDDTFLYDGTPLNLQTDPSELKAVDFFSDTPAIGLPNNSPTLTADRVGITESFVTYVNWLPHKYAGQYLVGTVPIPIGKMDWGWQAEADWSSKANAWIINNMTSSAPQPTFTLVSTSTYPQWSQSRPWVNGQPTLTCQSN